MRRNQLVPWGLTLAVLLAIGSPARAFPWLWFVPPVRLDIPTYPVPDLTPSNGLKVTFVTPDGPADRAGIERGDVILQVNGERMRTVFDLAFALRLADDEIATMLIFDRDSRKPEEGRVNIGHRGWIGVQVREVRGDWREHTVQLTAVRPYGPAAIAGLKVGDQIKAVEGRRVRNPSHLAAILRDAGPAARVTYVDGETGKLNDAVVRPNASGKIGVNAVRTPISKSDKYPY